MASQAPSRLVYTARKEKKCSRNNHRVRAHVVTGAHSESYGTMLLVDDDVALHTWFEGFARRPPLASPDGETKNSPRAVRRGEWSGTVAAIMPRSRTQALAPSAGPTSDSAPSRYGALAIGRLLPDRNTCL